MKNFIDDQFDNIEAAITNNGDNIDIKIMNTNKKLSRFIPLSIPFYPTSNF